MGSDSQYCLNLIVAGGQNNFSTNYPSKIEAPHDTATSKIEDYHVGSAKNRKMNLFSKDPVRVNYRQAFTGQRIPQKPNYMRELKGKATRVRSQDSQRLKTPKIAHGP